jgi:hypothetical protein
MFVALLLGLGAAVVVAVAQQLSNESLKPRRRHHAAEPDDAGRHRRDRAVTRRLCGRDGSAVGAEAVIPRP